MFGGWQKDRHCQLSCERQTVSKFDISCNRKRTLYQECSSFHPLPTTDSLDSQKLFWFLSTRLNGICLECVLIFPRLLYGSATANAINNWIMWRDVMRAANIMDTSVHALCELAQIRCIKMTELVLHELIIKWLCEKGVALSTVCAVRAEEHNVYTLPTGNWAYM